MGPEVGRVPLAMDSFSTALIDLHLCIRLLLDGFDKTVHHMHCEKFFWTVLWPQSRLHQRSRSFS